MILPFAAAVQTFQGKNRMKQVIRINEKDNVAVALCPISAGTIVEQEKGLQITALEDIPQGHKIALTDISGGEDVIKYGFPIGHTTENVKAGQWLHTRNVRTNLEGEISYTYEPGRAPVWNPAALSETCKDLPAHSAAL